MPPRLASLLQTCKTGRSPGGNRQRKFSGFRDMHFEVHSTAYLFFLDQIGDLKFPSFDESSPEVRKNGGMGKAALQARALFPERTGRLPLGQAS